MAIPLVLEGPRRGSAWPRPVHTATDRCLCRCRSCTGCPRARKPRRRRPPRADSCADPLAIFSLLADLPREASRITGRKPCSLTSTVRVVGAACRSVRRIKALASGGSTFSHRHPGPPDGSHRAARRVAQMKSKSSYSTRPTRLLDIGFMPAIKAHSRHDPAGSPDAVVLGDHAKEIRELSSRHLKKTPGTGKNRGGRVIRHKKRPQTASTIRSLHMPDAGQGMGALASLIRDPARASALSRCSPHQAPAPDKATKRTRGRRHSAATARPPPPPRAHPPPFTGNKSQQAHARARARRLPRRHRAGA